MFEVLCCSGAEVDFCLCDTSRVDFHLKLLVVLTFLDISILLCLVMLAKWMYLVKTTNNLGWDGGSTFHA